MFSLITVKHFLRRKSSIIFIVFFVSSCSVIHYMNVKNVSTSEPCIIMHLKAVDNNISCHYEEEGDALPSTEDSSFSPRSNSIFFHETSCRGGINSRQACAVESASRAHPEREVYVLFSAPVSELVYRRSCIGKLRDFSNIKFARVHIDKFAKNTPLEEMVASAPFKKSKWAVEHTSDILRILSLYKWGGLYLDSDVLVVKSLTPLGYNWLAWETDSCVNNAAIAISMDGPGRKFVDALLKEVGINYKPDSWGHNGPGLVMRVLYDICNVSEESTFTCEGIEVLDQKYIYPVNWERYDDYFQPGPLEGIDEAYTHHLWNKLTYDIEVERDYAYTDLARELCPTIYQMYGDDFGS